MFSSILRGFVVNKKIKNIPHNVATMCHFFPKKTFVLVMNFFFFVTQMQKLIKKKHCSHCRLLLKSIETFERLYNNKDIYRIKKQIF
jgi:hypothetical protein